jgi:hypothetical protein
MGHCGRTGRGNNLFSLRETIKLPGGKYTLNRSHLTASISDEGILYQLKGPKNSKPKAEFHEYIVPLFFMLGGGGEEHDYYINGFGSEYASNLDFKLSDLPEESIKVLYRDRPELFSGYGMIACWAQYGAYQFNKSGRANWIVVFMTQQFPAKTSSPI